LQVKSEENKHTHTPVVHEKLEVGQPGSSAAESAVVAAAATIAAVAVAAAAIAVTKPTQ
jgi:hypothetical protein